jgi:histone H3/H4
MARSKQIVENSESAPRKSAGAKVVKQAPIKKLNTDAAAAAEEKPKSDKPRRFKSGTVANWEVTRVANLNPRKLLTKSLPFRRLVREIIKEYNVKQRMSENAYITVQKYAETCAITFLSGARLAARERKVVIVDNDHLLSSMAHARLYKDSGVIDIL